MNDLHFENMELGRHFVISLMKKVFLIIGCGFSGLLFGGWDRIPSLPSPSTLRETYLNEATPLLARCGQDFPGKRFTLGGFLSDEAEMIDLRLKERYTPGSGIELKGLEAELHQAKVALGDSKIYYDQGRGNRHAHVDVDDSGQVILAISYIGYGAAFFRTVDSLEVGGGWAK